MEGKIQSPQKTKQKTPKHSRRVLLLSEGCVRCTCWARSSALPRDRESLHLDPSLLTHGLDAELTLYIDFKGREPLWETRAINSMAKGGGLHSQGMDVHAGALLVFSFGIS